MTLQELITKHVKAFEAWPAPGSDYDAAVELAQRM